MLDSVHDMHENAPRDASIRTPIWLDKLVGRRFVCGLFAPLPLRPHAVLFAWDLYFSFGLCQRICIFPLGFAREFVFPLGFARGFGFFRFDNFRKTPVHVLGLFCTWAHFFPTPGYKGDLQSGDLR